MRDLEDGVCIASSIPCILPKCESSDAGSLYKHEDGRVNFHCFSCDKGVHSVDPDTLEKIETDTREYYKEETYNMDDVQEIFEEFDSDRLKARKIHKEVAELYGVKVGYDTKGEQDAHMYPTHDFDGNLCGYAKRETYYDDHPEFIKHPERKEKKLGKMKAFSSVGKAGGGKVQMFGQELFPAPIESNEFFTHRLYICTGQEDALAGYEMTKTRSKRDTGFNFVSVVGGDKGGLKNLKANLKYASAFDEIYICADKDDSGKEFEKEACKVLPVGKVKLVNWQDKNAKDLSDLYNKKSEILRNGGAEQLMQAIWNATDYSPVGIRSLSQGWKEYLHRGEDPLIPFPESFGNLNSLTCGGYGADGEIINIAAPSSVGKSLFVKEMVYTALKETDKSIGVISLEETLPEFLEGLLSVHMSQQLNEIPFDERDRKAEREAFVELININSEDGGDRIHFLDDPGACKDEEDLWDKVDFLIKGLDCTIIVLDPVTLALSLGLDEDEYNATLVKKTKRHKLAWINVHHVRKNSGGSIANSEGADLAEEDIKGSGSHFQTGMINLILTRNKIHDNVTVKNTTKIKLSKCRRHGKNTGIAGFVYYNGDTGRLEQGIDPKIIMEQEDMVENEFDFDETEEEHETP